MKLPFRASFSALALLIVLAASAGATPADPPAQAETIVRRAMLTDIQGERELLALIEYIEKLSGIIEARRVEFDREKHEALIEITMEPATDKYWRAHLEAMPRSRIEPRPSESRPKLPDWYTRDTEAQEESLARRASFSRVESETQLHGIKRVIEMMKDVRSVSVSSWNSEVQTAVLDVALAPDGETSWDEFVLALDAARSGASAAKTTQP
ncbi:MAG: hypothetical protein RLZZ129_2671 [Verrucomicrobiota bacterium]|jgi:hypothetical protein